MSNDLKQKINVLHIVSNISIRNGIMSVLMNYYRNLNNERVHFSFLYYDYRDDTYENEILELGGSVYKITRKSFIKEWKEFCKSNYKNFDVLHNHELYLSIFLVNSKKILGNQILISHAHATRFSDHPIKELRNKLLSYPAKIISDYLLACSNDAGFTLFQNDYLLKGYLLRNAINVEKFEFNFEARERIRRELAINKGQYVVGHIGNFTPPKNHMFIVEIFNEILKVRQDAILLLVGDGHLRKEVIKRIHELGISKHVIFTGVRSNVEDYLCAMDVFVFPSKFEGLGIALIEAQANGLPCVYSSVVPQTADILKDNNKRISLDKTSEFWANNILCMNTKRYFIDDIFKTAGYDISEESIKLEHFYGECLTGKKGFLLQKASSEKR